MSSTRIGFINSGKSSKSNHKKSTALEVQDRVSKIYNKWLTGTRGKRLVDYIMLEFSVCESQARNYIKKVVDIRDEILIENGAVYFKESYLQTNALYEQCIDRGDFKTAAKVLYQLNEMRGAFGKGNAVINIQTNNMMAVNATNNPISMNEFDRSMLEYTEKMNKMRGIVKTETTIDVVSQDKVNANIKEKDNV